MIYLIIATVCFSLSFGIIKTQLTDLSSELIVFSRLIIAGVIFLPFATQRVRKEQLLAGFIGIIQFGVMYLCFIKAFKYLHGNEVALLTTSTPIFVLLWSTLFGERFRWIYLFTIIMSVAGAIVILWDNVTLDIMIKGILLMEGSNCSFALGQVLWKKYLKTESHKYMASAYLSAGLFVLPILIKHWNFTGINFSQLVSIIYLGIVPTGIGFWLWNKGSKHVKYSTLALFNNIKIPTAILFAVVLFGEHIDITRFICGATIMTIAFIVSEKVRKG